MSYGYGKDLADFGWRQQTGIGDANSDAALAAYAASGNFWNTLLNGAKTVAGMAGKGRTRT